MPSGKPRRRKGTEMQVVLEFSPLSFSAGLLKLKVFLGIPRFCQHLHFCLFRGCCVWSVLGREQMFVLLDSRWTQAVTQHRADGLKLSSHLNQTDNPNCLIFLVHILIVKWMAFQAAFRNFTALSNYSTFMLIRIWKCLHWTWIFLLWLSLHPVIHALVLTSLTALKPELFL